jgi:hypothetical protein
MATISVDDDEQEYFADFTRIDSGSGEGAMTVLIFGTGERERKLAKEIAGLLDGEPTDKQLADAFRDLFGKNDMEYAEVYPDGTGKAVVAIDTGTRVVDAATADALWAVWGEEGDWRG